MTAPTRTTNPLRAKALGYLRDSRVTVRYVGRDEIARLMVDALISPASGDRSGISVAVGVRMLDGVWNCSDHPGANDCSHRLAVQMVTGWAHLQGRWQL
jgi:hypothetical protein